MKKRRIVVRLSWYAMTKICKFKKISAEMFSCLGSKLQNFPGQHLAYAWTKSTSLQIAKWTYSFHSQHVVQTWKYFTFGQWVLVLVECENMTSREGPFINYVTLFWILSDFLHSPRDAKRVNSAPLWAPSRLIVQFPI